MSSDDMPAGLKPSTVRRPGFGVTAALTAALMTLFVEAHIYFWIAVGSALGGIGRYWCSGLSARLLGETFPWGTLLINVLGSFVIGFFGTLTGPDGRIFVGSTTRQFVMIGICGGFTTFSSFSLQALTLLNESEWVMAGSYVVGSVALCLIAVWAGYSLAVVLNTLRLS